MSDAARDDAPLRRRIQTRLFSSRLAPRLFSHAMTEPCVSILIPCHNAEPWIAATIESALAQTWPNTEIIVVDDGSTDDSAAIASRSIDRGVRVVMQSNRGASAARNAGLAQAR